LPPRFARSVLAFAAAATLALLLGCNQFAGIGTADQEDQDVTTPSDAGPADATAPGDAGAHLADTGAVPEDAAAQCVPPAVAGPCNPLTNEGCDATLSMQCAVDLLATVPTGYCIFSAPPPSTIGGACLNSGVTESCPPISSCVDGVCRALCLCDADCGDGLCCTRALENTGFEVCRDC